MNTQLARAAHTIPHAHLRAALRGGADIDMHALRSEFAQFVAGERRTRFGSWQEAWNAWTGAVPGSAGSVRIRQHCTTCHGRGVDMRRGAVCAACTGRRQAWVTAQALWLEPTDAGE